MNRLDRNHNEDLFIILKLHEIIKRYELLVEHLIAISPTNDEEDQFKHAFILCNGNVTEITKLLGCSRNTVYNKMKKFNVEVELC